MFRRVTRLLLVAIVLAACDDGTTPVEPDPPGPEPPPEVVGVSVDDSLGPIFRTLSVNLDDSSPIQVEYWADSTPRLRVSSSSDTDEHEIFLPRLRPETAYQYEIRAAGLEDDSVLHSGDFETDTLPSELSELVLDVSGVPTFPLLFVEVRFPWQQFIVDPDGVIVWYRPGQTKSTGFTRLANGDFVFNEENYLSVVTPDLRTVARLDRTAEMGLMHHEVITTADNTVLFLAQQDGVVNDTLWTGEAIWEWDPESGELVRRWNSFDFLSPTTDRGDRTRTHDWLHANSLAIGPRGNVLVSFFWLHEVLSIAEGYGSLEWRLGGPASTFVVTDGSMEAGQHTAAEVSPGRVLLFDNGLDRPGNKDFSRASEIELDHEDGTAMIAWQFRPDPDIFAAIMSSVRRLENGNTVVTFGTDEGVVGSTGPVSVFEVTQAGDVVWSMTIDGVRGVYRSTPIEFIGAEEPVE